MLDWELTPKKSERSVRQPPPRSSQRAKQALPSANPTLLVVTSRRPHVAPSGHVPAGEPRTHRSNNSGKSKSARKVVGLQGAVPAADPRPGRSATCYPASAQPQRSKPVENKQSLRCWFLVALPLLLSCQASGMAIQKRPKRAHLPFNWISV